MTDQYFATIIFSGERFDAEGIPLESLRELIEYQNIIKEFSKCLYREKTNRVRVPKGFEQGLELKLQDILPGSKQCVLHLPESTHLLPGLEVTPEIYAKEAQERLNQYISLDDVNIPGDIKSRVNRLGRSLGEKEKMLFKTSDEGARIVEFDRHKRRLLQIKVDGFYTEDTTVKGVITSYDASEKRFCVEDRGERVYGQAGDWSSEIVDLLSNYTKGRNIPVSISCAGKFNRDGKIVSILNVFSLENIYELPDSVHDQLEVIASLREGWFDGGGYAFAADMVTFVEGFLGEMSQVPVPYLYPEPDGSISAQWSIRNLEVEVVFTESKDVKMLTVDMTSSDLEDHWEYFSTDDAEKIALLLNSYIRGEVPDIRRRDETYAS